MNKRSIKNKTVVFLGTGFYDYDEAIKQKLEKFGADVLYYTQEPTTLLYKIKRKLSRSGSDLDAYHNDIIELINKKASTIDFCFVIKGDQLSLDFLERLKAACHHAIFLNYQWDSLSRVPGAYEKISFFDRVFSFDSEDCKNYNLQFRPLFYRDEIKNAAMHNIKAYSYSYLFVGIVLEDRLTILNQMDELISKYNLQDGYKYLMLPITEFLKNPLLFFNKNVHFKKMNYQTYLSLMSHSMVIVDFPHSKQSGLTMRAIETLGMKKKLITTSELIQQYDFYNPANILHFKSINKQNIFTQFFTTEYQEVSADIYDHYSLNSWINYIFCSE